MKIILLNSFSLVRPIFGEPEAIYPPLGILYIASYLRKNGYNKVKVVDGGKIGMRKTLEIIKKEDFDILGISSTTWAAEGARYLIKYVKNVKDKKVPIIVGEPHATATPFQGSDLYYLAQKYNLIEIENFSYWNQSSYFIMRLPNVRREDIEKIKGMATLFQALTMIRFRKAINPKMLRYYYGKVLLILNYILRNMW
jgi:radical SAM superfamily enzyme YgiQ (UPF0313 family)